MPTISDDLAARDRVVIYRGDDLDRLTDFVEDVTFASRAVEDAILAVGDAVVRDTDAAARFGDDAPDPSEADAAVQAAREVERAAIEARDAFIREAADRATEVEIKTIGRTRFRELVTKHPPRDEGTEAAEGVPDYILKVDKEFRVNSDTFGPALLEYHDTKTGRRTIVDPGFDTGDELTDWLDTLSEGVYESLWRTAYRLNRQGAVDPKALLSSTSSPRSSETAK